MSTETKCAWCEAEAGVRTAGSHGICERHAREMRAAGERLSKQRHALLDAWGEQERVAVERGGWWSNPTKRADAIEFSACVVVVAMLLGLAVLAMAVL